MMHTCFTRLQDRNAVGLRLVALAANEAQLSLEGQSEQYQFDFDATAEQMVFDFKLYGDATVYRLSFIDMMNDAINSESSAIARFFKTINVLGHHIHMAQKLQTLLDIQIDKVHSVVYLKTSNLQQPHLSPTKY